MQMQPTVPLYGDDAADTDSRNGHHRPEVYGSSGRPVWLGTDWRKHQRWISVDGQPVNTIDLGEGPPIVFVHGLTGSWPNWLEQLPVFAGRPQSDGSPLARHRVVAMDLPGFGHSPMPREQITIPFYARLLDGLLNQLGIDAAAIVGNSMGGFISAELAIAFPRRVERMVLVSPAGISTYRDQRETLVPVLRRLEPTLTALTAWGGTHADTITSRPALRRAILGGLVRYPGRLSATMAAELVRGAGKPGFMQALAANFDYDFRDRLPEIACPTLIVWGDHDRVVTVRDAAVYAELIPGSRKVIFKDTGHLTMVERPDAFNALLNDFLQE
jgi:pimeloyl-ACP methyl ester carboxylesterase